MTRSHSEDLRPLTKYNQSLGKKEGQANLEKVVLGTSGWSYKEWEKVFYPDSKTPKLSYYSGVFSTAEIDSTFYAYPNKGLAFGWARNTPDDFQFSAKIPKLITHDKKLRSCRRSRSRPREVS